MKLLTDHNCMDNSYMGMSQPFRFGATWRIWTGGCMLVGHRVRRGSQGREPAASHAVRRFNSKKTPLLIYSLSFSGSRFILFFLLGVHVFFFKRCEPVWNYDLVILEVRIARKASGASARGSCRCDCIGRKGRSSSTCRGSLARIKALRNYI